MERIIFHSDLNCCYANIELLLHPELRGKPIAVGGSVEQRRGVILARDELAKKFGIRAGQTVVEAMRLCPGITIVKPNMNAYVSYTNAVQEIYAEYTDKRSGMGIDEAWLDLTGCIPAHDAEAVANEIRERVKREIGLTVSVGVSWNLIFSKLGSDMKKPDAVTVITKDNYKDTVWVLPVEEMLMVGPATKPKLNSMGIYTIGELANADPDALRSRLGVIGYDLHRFANGWDTSVVRTENTRSPVKTIGNSTTAPRDLVCDEDVWMTLIPLCESVGMRLREQGFRCRVIEFSLRTTDLFWYNRQRKIQHPSDITRELLDISFALFKEIRRFPLRGIGVRASDLVMSDFPEQLDLFIDWEKQEKVRELDSVIDDLRRRFGYYSVQRATVGIDKKIGSINARTHTVHPIGFYNV